MKKLFLSFTALFMSTVVAHAACTGVFQPGSICGSVGGGPPLEVPSTSFTGLLPTNSITNSLLAQMPANTVKCNPTAGLANAQDCTSVALNIGGLGGTQAGAVANQVPVFPGSAGAAVPTTIGGTGGLFDTICSSTIGQIWVRLSSGWGCTSLGYANPVWWGADPTGSADSTSAFNSALVASTQVIFPPGKFKFNSAITYNIPAGISSVAIRGAGQDVTILTWPNASGGITINYNSPSSSVHISDLSLTTGTTTGGNALLLNYATLDSNPANTAISDVYRVTMRGDDGYELTDYWTVGLNIVNVSNTQVENLTIVGAAGRAGTGVNIVGLPASSGFAVVLNIAKSIFNGLANGLGYGTFVQGVTVDQTNMTNVTNGINAPAAESGLVQLSVTNSQIAATSAGIITSTAITVVLLTNNYFIVLNSSDNGINLTASGLLTITGNTVTCGTTTGTNGIIVGGGKGMVTGNNVNGCATGIFLTASSVNVAAVSNSINTGNTTAIVNSGTGNTVSPNYN